MLPSTVDHHQRRCPAGDQPMSSPSSPTAELRDSDDIVLSATNIVVEYRTPGRPPVRAVNDVSLDLRRGETLGIVGESGCGKSSTARALIQLPPPTSGEVVFDGTRLTGLSPRQLRSVRSRFQLIFQDPIASLNPRRTALQTVVEALSIVRHPKPAERAMEILNEVGVDEQMARRRPHELSGGQCQRVSIARSVALGPEVLVCDEPVSALDVSVQARVLNMLERMKDEYRLSLIFVSHDLAVVSNMSDRVAVMYLGRVVELAESATLYQAPRHHYTALLLSSIPNPAGERTTRGRTASEIGTAPPAQSGCPFAPRCPAATSICREVTPPLAHVETNRFVACHHPIS